MNRPWKIFRSYLEKIILTSVSCPMNSGYALPSLLISAWIVIAITLDLTWIKGNCLIMERNKFHLPKIFSRWSEFPDLELKQSGVKQERSAEYPRYVYGSGALPGPRFGIWQGLEISLVIGWSRGGQITGGEVVSLVMRRAFPGHGPGFSLIWSCRRGAWRSRRPCSRHPGG